MYILLPRSFGRFSVTCTYWYYVSIFLIPTVSEFYLTVSSARATVFSLRPIFLVVSALVAGLLISTALVWRVSLSSFLYLKGSPFSQGSKILGRTNSLLWEVSLEVFSRASITVVPWWRRSWRAASLISYGVFRVSVFTQFLWEGEDENRGYTRNC